MVAKISDAMTEEMIAMVDVVMTIAKEVAHVAVETLRLQLLVATVLLAVHIFNFLQLQPLVVAVKVNHARKTNELVDRYLAIKKTRENPESFLFC
jgi:hypothetical protein